MAHRSIVKEGLRYTADHEWVKMENRNARVGITDHAQNQLTEIVFIELPQKGKHYQRGEVLGQLESVKTVAAVYAPVSGEVTEVNTVLEEQTQLINESPYDEGWMAIIRMDEPEAEVHHRDESGYRKVIGD